MARPRDPRRDEAKQIWLKSNGKKKLKDIASELGCSDSQIRKWKNQDKWEQQLNGNVTKSKGNVTKSESPSKKETRPIEVDESLQGNDLTDKQRLFCMYYIKYFNATKAYRKAYDCAYSTAMVNGSNLLRNTKVRGEIDCLKEEQAKGIMLDAQFILQKYIDIALADITDFATFGKREQPVIGMYGPVKDEDGNVLTEEVSYVEFKESVEVDGTIITEVKQGKDGISVKLADKMKALDKLAQYFDLFPDEFKRKIENEKLEISKEKLALDKAKVMGDDEEYEDDGFIEALDGKLEEVWDDDDCQET
ncbi:terminase small subunit [Bacillus sp. FJAT-45350]|uniref:terminase small subunit n=1 Tax=Bacillus sp. FJAT-45350 TaxID=2011014 RepID=UPI000BB8D112|nr:terminase small subunit [Bacillus sp. FJAT-45350]